MSNIDPKHIEAVAALVEATLLREGGGPGNSLHSWRCEYPEMYGPCDCLPVTAAEVVEALVESTDPAVHAAMLDALTRHGVLTAEWAYDEAGIHWTSIDEKATRTDAAEVNAAVEHRLVTAWEVAP